jgi:hypothetical protein
MFLVLKVYPSGLTLPVLNKEETFPKVRLFASFNEAKEFVNDYYQSTPQWVDYGGSFDSAKVSSATFVNETGVFAEFVVYRV